MDRQLRTGMKIFRLFIILSILGILIIVVCFYMHAYSMKERTYHFPQISLYLKIVRPPINRYGYIFFSEDSSFSPVDNIDYVRIYKSDVSQIELVFTPSKKETIYLMDCSNNTWISPHSFCFERINKTDTLLFDNTFSSDATSFVLKRNCFYILIDGYLQFVYYEDKNSTDGLIKALPIQ